MIRDVKTSDAQALARIYNYYIENTIITFETESVSASEMEDRINDHKSSFPWLVLELNNSIIGYAHASEWKSRCAYLHTAESTIYLDSNYGGKGHGTHMYHALISILEKNNIHTIIGGIALPNEGSIKLHEKLGFKKIAHFEEVGYKFEKWIDVGYWQKVIK